jgi:predicted O-methyltransferase YrrM
MEYQDAREFVELNNLYLQLKPRANVLEIGSLLGETLQHWIIGCEPDGIVVSIDLSVAPSDPRYEAQRKGHEITWREWAFVQHVRFFLFDGDSKDPRIVQTVQTLLPQIDFLFIDGGHDRETCFQDYGNYGRLVRSGGLIAFHDLGREWPDVRKVWESIKQPGRRFEFCQSPERYGIGVLQVR